MPPTKRLVPIGQQLRAKQRKLDRPSPSVQADDDIDARIRALEQQLGDDDDDDDDDEDDDWDDEDR